MQVTSLLAKKTFALNGKSLTLAKGARLEVVNRWMMGYTVRPVGVSPLLFVAAYGCAGFKVLASEVSRVK